MGIIRVEKQKNYTVMSNYHLRDKNLTLKAKGLLSFMLSLPDGWDYTVEGLTYTCHDGRESIRATLIELEKAGYVKRYRVRDEKGLLRGTEYIVFEMPEVPEEDKREDENLSENDTDEPMTGYPMLDKPTLDKPTSENPPQINTKINNPPIIPPRGACESEKKKTKRKIQREMKTQPAWNPERWEQFWEVYPRGEKKLEAMRAWDKLKPSEDLLNQMALGLSRQLASEEWQRGIGIPYASTWLNQARWTDEVKRRPAEQETAAAPPPRKCYEQRIIDGELVDVEVAT